MVIERKSLGEQVHEELVLRMKDGDILPGALINEAQFAVELGVSRTPLREALIALEREGRVERENGKGFRFSALSAREFEELGPVIAALESLALRLTPRDTLQSIGEELLQLAAGFLAENAQHSVVNSKDEEWHTVMVSGCTNGRLLDLISSARAAIHRYESLLVADEVVVSRNAREHAEIARELTECNVPGAIVALEENWRNGIRRLLENPHVHWGS